MHTRVIVNSTIISTLGPWALDVVTLKYFEAIEMIESHKNILQIFNHFEILDNLIQPYPELQGIPTLVHPRVGDNNLLSEVVLLH